MFLTSKYNKLISEFEENKDKNWNEWITFDKMLDKAGKQGQVGLLKFKSG